MHEVDIHPTIKKTVDYFIETKKIPHIIFHGPGGAGKRYILSYLINSIYRDASKVKQYVMYVNCSHGKGIRFIRDELKFFAKTNIHNCNGKFFKSIVLFNADNLTTDAQSALRRCIEQFSHTTRFFVAIERKNKLLKPILSRFCNVFVPLPAIGETTMSLHAYRTQCISTNGNILSRQRRKWLRSFMGKAINYSNCEIAVKTVTKLYEKGYSALDIMDILRFDKNTTPIKKYTLLVFFDRIRREFRNEKLLMLMIINFGFMRPELSLENIEQM